MRPKAKHTADTRGPRKRLLQSSRTAIPVIQLGAPGARAVSGRRSAPFSFARKIAALTEARRADIAFLRHSLDPTDGNLSRYIAVPEEAASSG